jgi:hypothetical protein
MLELEGTPLQGSMRIQRIITTTVVTAGLVLFALAPASASAGSLLSGYGGPGQGNQEILGSGLVNGPSGGGSGGGAAAAQGAGAASLATTAGGSEQAVASGSAGSSTRGATHRAAHRGGGAAPRSTHQSATAPGAAAETHTIAPAADQASVSGQTLGLSGADVVYVLVALAALVLTALLTRKVTRRADAGTHAG